MATETNNAVLTRIKDTVMEIDTINYAKKGFKTPGWDEKYKEARQDYKDKTDEIVDNYVTQINAAVPDSGEQAQIVECNDYLTKMGNAFGYLMKGVSNQTKIVEGFKIYAKKIQEFKFSGFGTKEELENSKPLKIFDPDAFFNTFYTSITNRLLANFGALYILDIDTTGIWTELLKNVEIKTHMYGTFGLDTTTTPDSSLIASLKIGYQTAYGADYNEVVKLLNSFVPKVIKDSDAFYKILENYESKYKGLVMVKIMDVIGIYNDWIGRCINRFDATMDAITTDAEKAILLKDTFLVGELKTAKEIENMKNYLKIQSQYMNVPGCILKLSTGYPVKKVNYYFNDYEDAATKDTGLVGIQVFLFCFDVVESSIFNLKINPDEIRIRNDSFIYVPDFKKDIIHNPTEPEDVKVDELKVLLEQAFDIYKDYFITNDKKIVQNLTGALLSGYKKIDESPQTYNNKYPSLYKLKNQHKKQKLLWEEINRFFRYLKAEKYQLTIRLLSSYLRKQPTIIKNLEMSTRLLDDFLNQEEQIYI